MALRSFAAYVCSPVVAIFMLLLAGCKATEPPSSAQQPSPLAQLSDAERLALKNAGCTIGKEMLSGFVKNDYRLFTAHFSPAMLKNLDAKAFEQLRGHVGTIVKEEYLTELTNPVLLSYLWKLTVRKDVAAKSGDKKTYHGDILFQITVMKHADKLEVIGCWFK